MAAGPMLREAGGENREAIERQPLHYGLHIGHLGLDAVVGLAVGEAGAAAVVADEARERAQPLVPDAELGVTPLDLRVAPGAPRQM